jgi:hypothetical protein
MSAHIALSFETINQTHRAVVPEKHALGKVTNAGRLLQRNSTKRKQHLVLLWFEPCSLRGFVAPMQEMAYAVAKFSQCQIL